MIKERILWEACFQTLRRQTENKTKLVRKQIKYKIKINLNIMLIEIVNNLCVFLNKIENSKPPIKFNTLKCLDYQGMKDLMTHILHFKTTTALVSLY